jgi:transcriptional regulator with XRE-family HTH domain
MVNIANFKIDIDGVIKRLKIITNSNTDTELADKIGVTRQTVSVWRNKGNIRIDIIISACMKYNTSIDYILLGSPEKRDDIASAELKEQFLSLLTDTLKLIYSEYAKEYNNLTDEKKISLLVTVLRQADDSIDYKLLKSLIELIR